MNNKILILIFSTFLFSQACKKETDKKDIQHEVTYFINAPASYHFYYTNEKGEEIYSGKKEGFDFGGGPSQIIVKMKTGAKATLTAYKNGNGGLFTVQILVDGKIAKELKEYNCFCDDRTLETIIE